MQGTSGLDFLEQFNAQHPNTPVIVMTAHSDLQSAVTSFERGAYEYLPAFDVDDAGGKKSYRTQRRSRSSGSRADYSGNRNYWSHLRWEVFRAIGRLSSSNVSVLINGPSGSERVGRTCTAHSPAKPSHLLH